jgi:hypothetical protein
LCYYTTQIWQHSPQRKETKFLIFFILSSHVLTLREFKLAHFVEYATLYFQKNLTLLQCFLYFFFFGATDLVRPSLFSKSYFQKPQVGLKVKTGKTCVSSRVGGSNQTGIYLLHLGLISSLCSRKHLFFTRA